MINPHNGLFVFTPNANFSGAAGFSYKVVDAAGNSATAFLDINILSPIVTNKSYVNGTSTFMEGSLNNLVSSGFPPYSFLLISNGVGGTAQVTEDGNFTFNPHANFNGQGGFIFQVTDSNGGFARGSIDISIGSPLANQIVLSTCNAALTGNLNSYVTGGKLSLFFEGPISSSNNNAQLTINSDGVFNFSVPTILENQSTFVYKVTDSNGCSSTGTLIISANVIPATKNKSYTIVKNSSLEAKLSVSGGIPPYTYSITSNPNNGIISVNSDTGEFSYSPNIGFAGLDSFKFQVSDSSAPVCKSNIGNISIIVNETIPSINDPFFALVVSHHQ